MKHLDEFRDPRLARRLLDEIERSVTGSWSIMEVCGGQTHSIIRHGIDQLLPDEVHLVHGPGCPVCVTPASAIDNALVVAARDEVIFCSFGDMLRVPGTEESLGALRARGADVRVVYSPLDAVAIAEANSDRQVVFFAIGFETTAPANAMAIRQADRLGLHNFSALVTHVLVPPALAHIAGAGDRRIDAFLAAGHVCSVMGTWQYEPLVQDHGIPIVVTGFEPLDILDGVRRVVAQLEAGTAELDNAYARVVSDRGNSEAQRAVEEVFEVCDRQWRGIGSIASSGWCLSQRYRHLDAEYRFGLSRSGADPVGVCRSGEVLQGLIQPDECEAFGTTCSPGSPLGAPMVSNEGACAAYHQFRRLGPVAISDPEPAGG